MFPLFRSLDLARGGGVWIALANVIYTLLIIFPFFVSVIM